MQMTQQHYNDLVGALDRAMDVWLKEGKTEEQAQAALTDFYVAHYLKVWRPMNAVGS